jgi:nitrate reductase delta subunit
MALGASCPAQTLSLTLGGAAAGPERFAADEIRQVIDGDTILPLAVSAELHRLIDDLAGGDLYDLQERYGLLFDRTRSLSLHLFEHVHGESRDRGQAMVDLKALYERHGLAMSSSELPDHLPLFLEFLSAIPEAEEVIACTVTGACESSTAARRSSMGSPF